MVVPAISAFHMDTLHKFRRRAQSKASRSRAQVKLWSWGSNNSEGGATSRKCWHRPWFAIYFVKLQF
jgi:hypothetical protein